MLGSKGNASWGSTWASIQGRIGFIDGETRSAVASQALTSGANFATTVIVIQYSGLSEFGRFSIAFLAMMMARNFLNGAVLAPMSSIGPKIHLASQRAYRGFLLANGLVFAVASSLVIWLIFVGVALAFKIDWLLDIAVFVALANFLAHWSDFFRRQQFVAECAHYAFLIDLIRYVVQLVILFVLGESYLPWRLNGTTALFALAMGAAMSCVLGVAVFGGWCWRPKLSASIWPRHRAFVRWMLPSVALDTIQSMIPQFATTALLGEAALGLVRAIQQIANILNLPFNALQQTLNSRAAIKLRDYGFDGMARYLRSVGIFLGLAAAVVGSAVVLSRGIVFELLTIENDTRTTIIILAYMTLNVLITMRFADQVLVNAVEDPRANFWLGIAGAVSSVAFTFALLPFIGEVAVPIVGIANAVVTWGVLLVWIRKRRSSYARRFELRARQ